jgi:hypothetical protein
LKGELATAELPGVTVNCWQVVLGAPGCPGPLGLVAAAAFPKLERRKAAIMSMARVVLLRVMVLTIVVVNIKILCENFPSLQIHQSCGFKRAIYLPLSLSPADTPKGRCINGFPKRDDV